MLSDNEQFQVDGFTFRVNFENDDTCEPPWEREAGHGPVTGWERRDKKPGELVLCSDRNSKRFYDFQAAVKLARADCWGAPPYTGTKGERAARAARADFEYLRGFCNDEWTYIGILVHLIDDDNHALDTESLWGVDSASPDYIELVARDLAKEILFREMTRKEKVDAALSQQEEEFRVC